jgi:hypothetical protein
VADPRCIPGWAGRYAVDDTGAVLKVRGTRWVPVKVHRSGNGYLTVNLWHAGKRATAYVHRLVAQAFIGPIADGMTVNHKDGDKANPALSNLEIVTHAQNMAHASRTGLFAAGRSENREKAACPQGHPYDAANTYRRPSGGRGCRACRNAAANRFKSKERTP